MSSEAAERLVAGRWTLETALRRGPSGVIWRATEVAGGRHLAVEQLRLPAPPDPADPGQSAVWDRVAVETRAAASLGHPGLVGLEDVVVEDGVVFVATELVDAALTLDELVARHGPLPVRRVAQLGLELLDALEAAHAAGLVHLDLRPGNVLVTADGRARLAGVGLATLRRDLGAGSPGADRSYLAPEQLRGGPVGSPADLWSLGTILWLAVEGEPPFAGEGTDATATAILDAPPPPATLAGPLTPALHALLTKPPGGRPSIPDARRLLEPPAGVRPSADPGAAAPGTGAPGTVAPGSAHLGAAHPGTVAPGTGAPALVPGVPHPPRPISAPPEGESNWWGSRVAGIVHSPPYGSRAARNAMDPLVQRVLLIAGGSIALALVAFVVAVAVTGDPLGLRSQAVASTVAAAAPPTTGAPSTAPPTTVPPSTTAAALVPPGWSVHTDPGTQYQIAVPPGWQVTGDGQRTELRDQSSPTFLRIDWQQDPQADPLTLEQQASQAHAGERGGYSQARLEPSQFKGLPAALLEFTYQDGETWHALELGVRSPRHHIALAIYARDRDWGAGWALFEAFKASFVPPAG
jgi:eukaryotic-like serine/threonine-protein kinase